MVYEAIAHSLITVQGSGTDLGGILAGLEGAGFYELVLPFLLVFAIVFGLLSAVGPFQNNNAASAVIALVIGLFFLREEALYGNVAQFLQNIMGPVGLLLAVGLLVIIPLAFGTDYGDFDQYLFYAGAAIAAGVAIIAWQGGALSRIFGTGVTLPVLGGIDIVTLAILLFAVALIVWMVKRAGGR